MEDYWHWQEEHKKISQAKEFGEFNSVALESKLAPVVFRKSIEQKLFYSTVVGDGDDKSVNTLVDLDIYGEYGVSIIRKECLSHLQKRIRMHLIEKQKEFINSQKMMMQHELAVAKNEVEK